MTMAKAKHTPPSFPMLLARLDHLQGGTYGNILMRALSKERVELQLGGDYVLLTTADARTLHTAFGRYLAVVDAERSATTRGTPVVVDEEAVEIVVATPPKRRGARPRRQPQPDVT
jgi:hypothetical protein